MLIDTHQHAAWLNKDTRGVVVEMDQLGIDVAWLLTWYLPRAEDNLGYHQGTNPVHVRPDGTHPAMPLSDIVQACHDYPKRFVPGYCPGPEESPEAWKLFEAAYHMHGVRVCGEWSYRMLLDDPRALELFHAAGKLNCPVVLHMDVPFLVNQEGKPTYQKYWHGGTVANLERALRACPETIFIGHAPGFWREISGDADTDPHMYPPGPIIPGGRLHQLFSRYPNLWADLSAGSGLNAMRRDRAHGRKFIIDLADRLLFGRDQFGDDLRQFLLSLDLPPGVLNKIFYENALRLVPLP